MDDSPPGMARVLSRVAGSEASGSARRRRLLSLCLIVGLALLVSLPLLLPPVLPLADIGGHIGRYAVQLDAGRDVRLGSWYSFSWLLIPNLGADILVQAFGPYLGLEPTVRAIVMLAAFLQALGILATSRVVHGRITPFAVVALPLVYAHSMLYGFLNYTLALGLLWCSLALWIAMGNRGAVRSRWAVFAIIATVIWTCHLVGWALLCIAAGSQELTRQRERKGALIPAALSSALPLTSLLVPWLVKLLTFQPATGSGESVGWFWMADKLAELATVLRDTWHWWDILSVDFVVAVVLWTWLSRWTRLNQGLILASLITAICFMLVPGRLLGSAFADQRLIEPALLFALLAPALSPSSPPRLRPSLFAGAAVFAGVRLAACAVSLWQIGNRSAEELKVLEMLPSHAQMVYFRALNCPPPSPWVFDRRTHLSGYAIARRHAFSNDQWVLPGGQLLKVHNPAAGEFQIDPSEIVFERACGSHRGVAADAALVPAAIPYLWVVWTTTDQPLPGWAPIARHGLSILYRRSAG